MTEAFRRLPLLWQNILIGFAAIMIVLPMYMIPNIALGERPGMNLAFWLDNAIPFAPWTVLGYSFIYVFVFLPIFTIRDRPIFWRMVLGFVLCSVIALPFFIWMPVRMPRPGIPTQESLFYWGVALSYILDKPVNCFPSLHVANSVFAVACCMKLSPRVGFWGVVGTVVIAISTTTLRQHFIADVASGTALAILVYFLVVHPVVRKAMVNQPIDDLIFPPKTALWVFYLYLGFVASGWLLFQAGLRFQPVLPVN